VNVDGLICGLLLYLRFIDDQDRKMHKLVLLLGDVISNNLIQIVKALLVIVFDAACIVRVDLKYVLKNSKQTTRQPDWIFWIPLVLRKEQHNTEKEI
jgi:hypothetical protein